MNLRQQIIANRDDEFASALGIEVTDAFMRLAFSLVTGTSVHAFDPSDIVDGGQDKQMDVFAIEEQGDSANVFIVQTKYNENSDGAVFDLNIQRFLGGCGAVNKDIHLTCTSVESSYEFWFLNNGITFVCDKFDPVTDPDNAHVKLQNLQIVNGCQTATTIALAQKEGKLAPDVRVLTWIYQTQDPAL